MKEETKPLSKIGEKGGERKVKAEERRRRHLALGGGEGKVRHKPEDGKCKRRLRNEGTVW